MGLSFPHPQHTTPVMAECAQCHEHSDRLRHCTQCQTVLYCSKECQKKHWLHHKVSCKERAGAQPKRTIDPDSQGCTTSRGGHNQTDSLHTAEEMAECAQCHEHSDRLRHCTQCQTVLYCSKECQKKHWLHHKVLCKERAGAQPKRTIDPDSQGCTTSRGEHNQTDSLQTAEENEECDQCHKRVSGLRCCTRCLTVRYCSHACQTIDWPKHKTNCKSMSSKPLGAPPGEKPRSGADNLQSGIISTCKRCGKTDASMQKCGRCHEETYCSKDCQKQDWASHKVTCTRIEVITTDGYRQTTAREKMEQDMLQARLDYTKQFIANLSSLTSIFVPDPRIRPTLTWANARSKATRLYPRKRVVDVFADLDNDLFRIPNAEDVVLLTCMTSIYLHLLGMRRGMFLEDSTGSPSLILFYNSDDPEPYFNYDQLRSGNFLCIEHAYLHGFLDGTIGFRINNVNHVHIMES